MSQIKKALERAKAARQSDGFAEAAIAGRFLARGTLEAFPRPSHGPEPFEFPFTRTVVIDVAREDLLKNRIVALEESEPAADRFRLLRTQIFQLTRPHGWNTILVSGFGCGEGTSTLAANLAVSIAQDMRQTALLVDLDFRSPTIERLFGLEGKTRGLTSHLLDEAPLEELFVSPGIEKFTLLTAGARTAQAAELIGSPQMEALVHKLKHHYEDRYVIFDAPGIGTCPDPLILSEYVDAILLVGRAGHTTRESLRAALESLPKEKLLGIVMNDVPPGEASTH